MEDVHVQWRNSKALALEMIVAMEQTIDGLNGLEDNFAWSLTLLNKCFEAVGAKRSIPIEKKLMEGVLLSISMEKIEHVGQCNKSMGLTEEGSREASLPIEPTDEHMTS